MAKNHCAAVLLTNLVRYYMDRATIERIKAKSGSGRVFYDVHEKVGNGPVLRILSRAKRYVLPLGYQVDHRKVHDLESFRSAVKRGRPCAMLLMAQALEWHWVLVVGVRVYEDGSDLMIGKAVTLREGTDAVVFAAGIMLHEAMQAALSLEKQGVSVAVVDCFTIKPLDREAVIDWARKTGAVVVAENANRHGGLYTAVLEALAENCPVPAACVAVEDEFGEVGSQGYLQKRFGLTAAHIEEQVKAVVARKKA